MQRLVSAVAGLFVPTERCRQIITIITINIDKSCSTAASWSREPPFGGILSDKQVAEVTNYIRLHFGNEYVEGENGIAAFGDTWAQTVSVLEASNANLARLDPNLSDVVKMTVFLVAPGEGAALLPRASWQATPSSSAPKTSLTCQCARWSRSRASPTRPGWSR